MQHWCHPQGPDVPQDPVSEVKRVQFRTRIHRDRVQEVWSRRLGDARSTRRLARGDKRGIMVIIPEDSEVAVTSV